MAFGFLTGLATLLREISGAKTISPNGIGLQEKNIKHCPCFKCRTVSFCFFNAVAAKIYNSSVVLQCYWLNYPFHTQKSLSKSIYGGRA